MNNFNFNNFIKQEYNPQNEKLEAQYGDREYNYQPGQHFIFQNHPFFANTDRDIKIEDSFLNPMSSDDFFSAYS
jgi:hypothetical protein